MKKLVIIACLLPAGLGADILPEALGDFTRSSLEPREAPDAALYQEFGFEESSTAIYETAAGQRAEIVATRFYDDTGAFSAFLWERPAEGEEDAYGKRAWLGPESTLIHFGNYLVEIRGELPAEDNIELMLAYLPKVRVTPDPPMLTYMPTDGMSPATQKHILGPEALQRLAPEVAPSVAGFHFGAEAQFAEYEVDDVRTRLLLFSYPTPQMAREQAEKFYQQDHLVAKRSGPMIAAVVAAENPDAAQRLLAKVRYEAEVTLNYEEPNRHDNVGTLVLDVMILSGILASLCIAGGILVAGGRILAGRVAPNSLLASPEGDGMTHLGLDESLDHLNHPAGASALERRPDCERDEVEDHHCAQSGQMLLGRRK